MGKPQIWSGGGSLISGCSFDSYKIVWFTDDINFLMGSKMASQ